MVSKTPVKAETASVKRTTPTWEGLFGFPLFHGLSRELDAIFDRMKMDKPFFESTEMMWNPEMEVETKGNEFRVTLDVPGLKKDEITVEVGDEHLILRGERKHEAEEKKEGYFKTERTYGSFYRAVPLPEGVKPEEANAKLTDGVLTITMPMTMVAANPVRKLEIGGGTPTKVSKAA
jgi:HSP20 family protein